jgi:hypothetical protein
MIKYNDKKERTEGLFTAPGMREWNGPAMAGGNEVERRGGNGPGFRRAGRREKTPEDDFLRGFGEFE